MAPTFLTVLAISIVSLVLKTVGNDVNETATAQPTLLATTFSPDHIGSDHQQPSGIQNLTTTLRTTTTTTTTTRRGMENPEFIEQWCINCTLFGNSTFFKYIIYTWQPQYVCSPYPHINSRLGVIVDFGCDKQSCKGIEYRATNRFMSHLGCEGDCKDDAKQNKENVRVILFFVIGAIMLGCIYYIISLLLSKYKVGYSCVKNEPRRREGRRVEESRHHTSLTSLQL